MSVSLALLQLLFFGWVLLKSAHIVVRQASEFARNIGATSYVTAFLLLGLLTSTPEVFVAIESSVYGAQQLSVGNLIGGSILLLSFVFGICSVFLGGVIVNHGSQLRDIIYNGIVIASPALVLWDGSLSRIDGFVLTGIYVLYASTLRSSFRTVHKTNIVVLFLKQSKLHLWMLLAGFIGMLVASKFIVTAALVLSEAVGISTVVFGLIILSLGTNLPELSIAYQAVRTRHKSIALGDFMGSASANTLILGLMGIFAPFHSNDQVRVEYPLIMLLFITFYFIVAIGKKMHISRMEGFGLLLLYIMFIVNEFIISL